MEKFFHPKSIAVIGASEKGFGASIIINLQHGYKGDIFPVNPKYKIIQGISCFASIDKIPHKIDLAIILVKAPAVPSLLEACALKGVYRVIIESAGFAEVGKNGKKIQNKCKKISLENGIKIWGPNCMGLLDVPKRHFFTFMHPKNYKDGYIPGKISLIVQSGILSAIFLQEMNKRLIGLSKVCSIGNKMDVDECDILEYLLKDKETNAIALYVESIKRGRLFVDIANKSSKPIILLKGGRSKAGAQAAISHTSSLAGNSRVLDDVLKTSGVIIANDFYHMMELAEASILMPKLHYQSRVAILTLSGSAGILACDFLEKHGLRVAKLSKITREKLANIFPDWMPVSNPIDIWAATGSREPAEIYNAVISTALEDPNIDALIVFWEEGLFDLSLDLSAIKSKSEKMKKVICFWLWGRSDASRTFYHKAKKLGFTVHGDISRITESLSAISQYHKNYKNRQENIQHDTSVSVVNNEHSERRINIILKNEKIISEYESKRLLAEWGISVVEEKIVSSLSEAKKLAREWGNDVVLKGLLPDTIHKTELGLLHTEIITQNDVENAFRDLKQKIGNLGKILMQKKISKDYELIAGFLSDEQFGPCVMFGMGGILTEIQQDIVFALAPLHKANALHLLSGIKCKKLLEGFRGIRPLNKDLICDILVKLSNFGAHYPQIEQIDLNPVIVSSGVPVIVDANIVLKGDAKTS